ncbi:MAG TPA: pyridoxal phosphate-dependent aminotransferase [Bacteroidales bacterium]|jgi:aspartate/methionine/tyrosine aminotransferase|nr:pyridoxal phosphate-dependent aminotransferase [Bacteroidales bacterium]MDI9553429.1 pyridoxal phosphate-dependent aminotransferase [Bacteroidota bacterium]NLK53524.1 pyridoxal phosphate-dependent aminotransferase [Bacteroidales bacterium]HOG55873.1 pyridoxal phosphate-dependent aminotransferase [Bacteroidales bacterium]HPX43477.1 pyridoxal phosphate-dependent aminotransferase [Bacteroidales bacterium]
MDNIPISEDIIESLKKATGILSPGTASIREIVALVNRIEKETGIRFVRMEMGVPGLPAPEIGINAEIEALKSGVGSLYPDITGLRSLKEEASRFIKLFLDIDISPGGCIPTVGSMMGSMICFLVANRNDRTKEGSLFIDPGFPVQKQQVKMLGHNYFSFDIYNFRGKKLRDKLESLLETGKVSSLIYSNPNNPTWICLTEEELSIIGELCRKYDVIAIEDLAYFGMDFRKDYLNPGEPPFQPTVARYTDDYVLLISSSKIFSYAGQRIAIMAISDSLFNRSYPDLLRYYSSDKFGHSVVFGALYGISAGVSHSVQYGFSALLKAVNDGTYRFRDDIIEYGEKAKIMKELFTGNGFTITYDKDIDQPIADGFYFTISYPGMTASELIDALIPFGISAITLNSTGSERKDGLRACVSQVPRSLFSDLEHRLKSFRNKYPVK